MKFENANSSCQKTVLVLAKSNGATCMETYINYHILFVIYQLKNGTRFRFGHLAQKVKHRTIPGLPTTFAASAHH